MSVLSPLDCSNYITSTCEAIRDETEAGMMDCKNALSESEGDIIKAQELLRKKKA